MKNISEVDKNFAVNTNISDENIVFYNSLDKPFKIYGVFHDGIKFRRIPENIAKAVSDGVHFLHSNTAGGRLRFKTDSLYVAINTKMPYVASMPHFPFTGSTGFDIYIKEDGKDIYYKTFTPPLDMKDSYESIHYFQDKKMREITINFPLYSDVSELYIGLSDDAELLPPKDYKCDEYIVYYGSSITQGGCASRPGNSYQGIISRRFDCDHLNLGFSGNAKAEDAMIDYIIGLPMTIFVMDYDHNAPDVEYLERTHYKTYKKIREAKPELPIIILPRPKYCLDNDAEYKRVDIVKKTYDMAVESRDKNVYYLSNIELMELAGNDGTVDSCHPNDLGFFSMATAIGDVIEKIILNR